MQLIKSKQKNQFILNHCGSMLTYKNYRGKIVNMYTLLVQIINQNNM